MYLQTITANNSYKFSCTVNGKRYSTTLYGNYPACQEKATNIRQELKEAASDGREVSLISDRVKDVVAKPLTLSEASLKIYRRNWTYLKDGDRKMAHLNTIIDTIGDIPLKDLTTDKVEELAEELAKDRGLSTVNRYLTTLKTLCNKAYHNWGELNKLPIFPKFKEPQGRVRVLTYTEEKVVLTTLSKAAFIVLLDTGMRLGELLSLKSQHVDFNNSSITITSDNAKSGKRRVIPMTPRVVEYILEARRFTEHQIRESWRFARERLELLNDPEFVIHACRHTCASRLVQRGVPLLVVRDLLGHSTVQVTEKYAHVKQTDLVNAMKVLE